MNRPRDPIQPYETIAELLLAAREDRDPAAPGITQYAGTERVRSLSWAGYLDEVAAWAQHFSAQGVQPGERVATLMRNRLDVPLIYLALMAIGAVVVPLNPAYSAEEMDFVVKDAGVVGVILDRATGESRGDAFAGLRFVNALEDVAGGLHHGQPLPDGRAVHRASSAIILYTSGTTSFPKGVVQMHGNLVANAASMVREFDFGKPVQYSIMPFYHAHAVGFGMMTCLLTGGHLVMTDRMDALAWPQVIRAEGVTITSMVPNLLNMLVHTRVKRADVPTLRFVFVSAAPLPRALAERFEEQAGLRVAHAWGLSEFTNFATALSVDTEPALRQELMFGHETPCVGRPLQGVEVQVRRADGSLAEPSEKGELWIRGPSLTLGYHGNAHATAQAIQDGWLRSGDEGYHVVRDSTPWFFISDRIKDVIIRSGEKISPAAVEAMIARRLPDLANRIVAVGYAHAVYGEEVGLAVEGTDLAEIRDALTETLKAIPVRERPKVVIFGQGLIPRTHTGKIQRRLLRPRFAPWETRSTALHIEEV